MSDEAPVGQSRTDPEAAMAWEYGRLRALEFPAAGVNLESIERELVQQALAKARSNKSLAARLLGVPRGQFYSLLRRHGLTEARR